MRVDTLEHAIKEAKRFILKATNLKLQAEKTIRIMEKDKNKYGHLLNAHKDGTLHCEDLAITNLYVTGKDNASVKRASLDLTGVLADLRQGR